MLCHYYPPHPGGIEIVVWNLARALASRHEVTIVTSAIGSTTGTSVEDDITVVRTPAFNPTEWFGIPYPVPAGSGLARPFRRSHRPMSSMRTARFSLAASTRRGLLEAVGCHSSSRSTLASCSIRAGS